MRAAKKWRRAIKANTFNQTWGSFGMRCWLLGLWSGCGWRSDACRDVFASLTLDGLDVKELP